MKVVFCFIGFLWGMVTPALAQSAHQELRAGDKEYGRENYSAAQQHYQEAVRQNPGNLNATYNLGCAEYRQGKYPEAEKAFQQAVVGSQLPANKADALYNLGNAQMKQQKFKEAVEAYENSLRLRPGDAATKQNLQMAKQKLQEEQQQQKQKQKQRQQQDGQQPPNDQKQPSQNQPQARNEQPPPPKSGEQPNQGQEPSPQPTEPGKMTRQEAQRMLETTIGPEDRKNARKYRATVQPRRATRTNQKDW